jgi:hypothetical protein
MITLKKIIEGVQQESSDSTNELSGMMGRPPVTWDTPKAYAPANAPLRTNEELPSKKLTVEEKRKLLGMIGKFNEYRNAMKMAEELKQVAENIVYIAEMTEKYGLNETSEWFEGVTLERDMKEIKKYAMELHKIANKVHPQVQQAEAIYEEIGLKLERYFNL